MSDLNDTTASPIRVRDPGESPVTLSFINKLMAKIGSKTPEEDNKIRSDLIKITKRIDITKEIIKSNKEVVKQLAQTNKNIENTLSKALDSKLSGKLEGGSRLSKSDSGGIVDYLEDQGKTLKSIEDSNLAFTVSADKIVELSKQAILNDKGDLNDRRQMITELKSILRESGGSRDQLTRINDFSEKGYNGTKEQTETLREILSETSNSVHELKVEGTLRELNRRMDTLIATEDEIRDDLNKKDASGKSSKESLLSKGLNSTGLKRGLLDTALASVGLGGFSGIVGDVMDLASLGKGGFKGAGKIAGKVGGLGRGIGGFLGKAGGRAAGGLATAGTAAASAGGSLLTGAGALAGKAGGFLGKGAGMLGKVGGFGAKLLGKAAIPLALASAGYDSFKGYNNASEISGKKEEDLTTGDKLQSGLSAATSGLTFGLIDQKDIYKAIDSFIKPIFGEDGIIGSVAKLGKSLLEKLNFKEMWEGVTKFFDDIFSGEGILGKVVGLGKKVAEYSPVGLAAKGANYIANKVTGGTSSASEKLAGVLPDKLSSFFGFNKKMATDTGDITTDAIKRFEGYSATTYDDQVGNATTGYGHLSKPGDMAKYDKDGDGKLSEGESTSQLQDDIGKHQSFKSKLTRPITKEQEAAVTSLAFNIGDKSKGVNSIVDLINKGDMEGASAEFLKYNKAKDQSTGEYKELPGLTKRRQAEAALFSGKINPASTSALASNEPGTINTSAATMASKQTAEDRKMAKNPPPITVSSGSSGSRPTQVRTSIDSPELMIMNSIALEG